jgi:putative FmdB family regulatory protein
MPEYEYHCKKCEKAFVIERSMADSSAATCAHCNSDDISRVWNVNFLSGKVTSTKSGAATAEACATNPTKPKNCCPCG